MGMFMMMLTILSIMIFFNPNPLKLSLLLTYISILMSFVMYKMSSSIFIPSVMIISFSSGMMILFSYCSILCKHSEKSSLSKMSTIAMLMTFILPLLYCTPSKNPSIALNKMVMETYHSPYLILMMLVVIIAMIGINYSFFNPTKKFLMSY